LKTLGTLDKNLVDQIEHFFVSYNEIKGKTSNLWADLVVLGRVALLTKPSNSSAAIVKNGPEKR
jgi:hypothetical protein